MTADKFLGELWVGINVDTSGLVNATVAMKNMQNATQAAASGASTAMASSAKNMNMTLNSLSNNLYRFGTFASMAFTLPLTALATLATKSAVELEQIKQKTVALANVSQEQMDAWSGAITRIGIATNATSKSIAQALYFTASAGVDNASAMKLVEYAAKGTAAGLGETDTIAKLLTYTYNAYGKEVFDAAKRMDELTVAVREGAAEATDFAVVMGDLVPIAAQIGVTFADLGGMLAGMTQIGLNAHKSSTALRQIMMELIRPSHQAAEALDKASKKMGDMSISSLNLSQTIEKEGLFPVLQKLKTVSETMGPLFLPTVFDNIRAYNGLMAMIGPNMDKVQAIIKKTKEEVGAFENALSIMTQTSGFKLGQFKKAAELAFIDLGEAILPKLIPMLNSLTETINNLSSWFKSLSSSTQTLVLELGIFLAVLGPITIALSGMVRLWAILGMAMTGMIIPAIHALGTAFIFLSQAILAAEVLIPGFTVMLGATMLALAVFNLSTRTKELTASQKVLNDVNTQTIQSVIAEKVAIEQLMRIATNQNSTIEQKQKAIKTINSINPEYLEGITQETIRTGEATKAINKYITSLELKARKQAAYDALVEVEKKRAMTLASGSDKDLSWLQKVNPSNWSQTMRDFTGIQNADQATKDYIETIKKLQELLDSIKVEIPFINGGKSGNKNGKDLLPLEPSDLEKTIKGIQDTFTEGIAKIKAMVSMFGKEVDFSSLKFNEQEELLNVYGSAIDSLAGKMNAATPYFVKLREEFKKLIDVQRAGATSLLGPNAQMEQRLTLLPVQFTEALKNENDFFKKREQQKREWEFQATGKKVTSKYVDSSSGQSPYLMTSGFAQSLLPKAMEDYSKELNKIAQQRYENAQKFNEYFQMIGQNINGILSSYTDMLNTKQQLALSSIDRIAQQEGKSAAWVTKQKEKIDNEYNRKKRQIAIAQALINGALAITNIWAYTIDPTGVGLKIAASIASAANTAAQIAVISGQKMAMGGIVPSGYNNDTYPALLSSGETVVPPGKLSSLAIGSGKQTIHLTGRLVADGRDLVYVFDKEVELMKSY